MNVLITNTNAPTVVGAVYSLRKDSSIRIVGLDTKESFIGHLLDEHYTVEDFVSGVKEVCEKENIDVVVPLSIKERILLKNNLPHIKILSSNVESIERSNDKLSFLSACEKIGIPVPKYYVVTNFTDLKAKAFELGYPKKKVVVKPTVSSGSRGFRILNRNINYKRLFFESNSQDVELKLTNLHNILGEEFPPLIISEYLPGAEYTVDCLRFGDVSVAVPRVREQVKYGLTFKGRMEKNDLIIEYSKKLAEELNLETVFGFQFKLDENGIPKALECNPRVQGTMVMSTLSGANIILEGVNLLTGKTFDGFDIDWDMVYYRTFSGISVGRTKEVINL